MFMITNDSGDNDDGKIMTMVKMIMTMGRMIITMVKMIITMGRMKGC